MDVKILVAAHKKYWMPEDKVYMPLHVGHFGKNDLGYIGDDTGDNISGKNPYYCEMTGLYWAWKNLDCDYIGLCHYRRYFCKYFIVDNLDNRKKAILKKADYEKYLKQYDILLPEIVKHRHENIYEHYAKDHKIKDLELCGEIIKEKFPAYYEDYQRFINGKSMYYTNMFVMSKSLFDEYAEWIFTILFEAEKRTDISGYDDYQKRIYGFLAERLFNVWIVHQKLRVKELFIQQLEEEPENVFRRLKKYICKYMFN